MITDRNDAFKHNSCKKLAQLAKVIVQMSSIAKDREDELNNITIEYESTISQLVRQHIYLAEGIAKNLVLYRKGCIDKACQEYGVHYKVIKNGLSDLCKEKLQELQDILNESQSVIQSINTMQNDAIDQANQVLEAADAIQRNMSNLNRRPKTAVKRQINAALNPIHDKITKFQNELDNKLKQMRSQHAKNIQSNRNEIYKFLREEIINRQDEFNQYKFSLKNLKNEVNKLKAESQKILNDHDNANLDFKNKRNGIISTTKNSCRDISSQIQELQKKEKHNESERKFQINELLKAKQNLINSHQADIKNLHSQVNSQKHQRHQLTSSRSLELQKRQEALDSKTNTLKKEHENSMNMKNSLFEQICTQIKESGKDLQLINAHLQSIIEESTAKTANRKLSLNYQYEQDIRTTMLKMEKELNDYRDSAKARLNIFLNAFKSQMDLYQNIQKEKRNDISKLLEQLKALIAQNKKELEEKEKKEEKNKNDYQNANLARQQNRKQEIENVINRKISDRDRQISTLKNNFNSDLNKKKKELEEENKQKLNEYKEKIKSLDNVTNEENQHKTNILKMEGKLNYAVGQFERSKQKGEQKISLLQNEISNTEKTIRQIQRKIKMDSQAIDEEFEMKIQVEQVKLNNTIENISKLYDKEENLRGVELVEAIRKLRQIQNRTDDLCLKKQHEIDDEEKEFKEMQKSLENEIKEMKDKKTINDLTEKLNLLNEKAKNEIESVTKSNLDKIEKIEKQIEEKKTSHSERMNEMKKKIEEENIMFDSSINEFKANENSITNAANEQIDKYKLEYESRKKEMIDKHNEQVAKMKARIESAKGLQNETLEKKNQDYDKASDNENNLIAKKCNFDQESLNKVTQDFLKSDSNYAAKIYELICKIADLQINVYNSTIRKNEQQKINALKESIKKKDTEMAQLFESFYKMVDNVQKVPLSQVQSPLQFHVRPSNSRKSTTRGSKIESPKIIDVSKKHLHPIMSPQVV